MKPQLQRLTTTLVGIPVTELIARIPSIDDLTTWLKFLIQCILLIIALLQLQGLISSRKQKPKSPPPSS